MIAFYENYYTGQHPLPWLSPRAADEFREILRMSRSNYMGLVIDAQCERMMVEGFRVGTSKSSKRSRSTMMSDRPSTSAPSSSEPSDPIDEDELGEEGDAETWRIWTENNLDSEFDKALLESSIAGMSYLLVAPNDDEPDMPNIYVEHPSQAIVEYEPGSNRRRLAAGLKVYDDDWTGTVHAVLYLPDGIYKFKQTRAATALPNIPISDLERRIQLGQLVQPMWDVREVTGESWPAPNVLEEVPLLELSNNPRMLTGGRSELEDVTDIQDRVNKTRADRVVTQDYGAFPQKWVSGWPTVDDSGTATPAIDTGRNRIVTTEVVETKFGQWQAAALDPYNTSAREDIKDIASRTRTPAQYLLGEMSNVNGQTLKASESGLVAKVRQRMRNHDDTIERCMRLSRKAAGLPVDRDLQIQTLWRNPEHRTEGELVDALTKMATLGVPQEVLWERWGATPTEIRRWKAMQDAAAQKAAEQDPTTILAARYRELAGVGAIPMQEPDAGAAGSSGGSGGSGDPVKKSTTNNGGSKPGAPGVVGKGGRPGLNGRPRGGSSASA